MFRALPLARVVRGVVATWHSSSTTLAVLPSVTLRRRVPPTGGYLKCSSSQSSFHSSSVLRRPMMVNDDKKEDDDDNDDNDDDDDDEEEEEDDHDFEDDGEEEDMGYIDDEELSDQDPSTERVGDEVVEEEGTAEVVEKPSRFSRDADKDEADFQADLAAFGPPRDITHEEFARWDREGKIHDEGPPPRPASRSRDDQEDKRKPQRLFDEREYVYPKSLQRRQPRNVPAEAADIFYRYQLHTLRKELDAMAAFKKLKNETRGRPLPDLALGDNEPQWKRDVFQQARVELNRNGRWTNEHKAMFLKELKKTLEKVH